LLLLRESLLRPKGLPPSLTGGDCFSAAALATPSLGKGEAYSILAKGESLRDYGKGEASFGLLRSLLRTPSDPAPAAKAGSVKIKLNLKKGTIFLIFLIN
jgi:hypothetical protein